MHKPSGYQTSHLRAGLSPALVGAQLSALRRVDAVQPDALPVDLNCVAIDHAGAPDNRLGRRCRRGGWGLGALTARLMRETVTRVSREEQSWPSGVPEDPYVHRLWTFR